jgi:hypothetical protein
MKNHPLHLPDALPDLVSRTLRSLPVKTPPARLRTSLLVLASRERQRRASHRDFSSVLRLWRDRAELWYDGMVRSIALPLAGGVCSTMVLFSMFVVPAYPLLTHDAFDVPTTLTTPVSLKEMAPFSAGDTDVVVDVSVDGQGRMIDYAIVAGASVLANSEIRRRLENALVFSNFTPATSFGQPMTSKLRLWFHSSRIDVKG